MGIIGEPAVCERGSLRRAGEDESLLLVHKKAAAPVNIRFGFTTEDVDNSRVPSAWQLVATSPAQQLNRIFSLSGNWPNDNDQQLGEAAGRSDQRQQQQQQSMTISSWEARPKFLETATSGYFLDEEVRQGHADFLLRNDELSLTSQYSTLLQQQQQQQQSSMDGGPIYASLGGGLCYSSKLGSGSGVELKQAGGSWLGWKPSILDDSIDGHNSKYSSAWQATTSSSSSCKQAPKRPSSFSTASGAPDMKRFKSQKSRFGSTKKNNAHKKEPALNTNLKPRAKQGCANDPQSIAARHRRERISDRLKVLQELIPNGSKVDLVTMLEKAINYVKFLQLQVKVLMNDEYWPKREDEEEVEQEAL